MKSKELEAVGSVAFGKLPNKAFLQLWGPAIGVHNYATILNAGYYRCTNNNLRTTYCMHKKLSACFTKEEITLVMKINAKTVIEKKAIGAKAYNQALAAVPAWALKEIRRYNCYNRMRIARFLYHTGEIGIKYLSDQNAKLYLLACDYLQETGNTHKMALFNQDKPFKLIWREVFSNYNARERNLLVAWFNQAPDVSKKGLPLACYNTKAFDAYAKHCKRKKVSYPISTLKNMFITNAHDFKNTKLRRIYVAMCANTPPENQQNYYHLFSYIYRCYQGPRGRHVPADVDLNVLVDNPHAIHEIHEQFLQHFDPLGAENGPIVHQTWDHCKAEVPLGITCLTSTAEVIAEGEAMHHCVATYAEDAYLHKVHLFHVEYNGEKATLMVRFDFSNIMQLYGPCNAQPSIELVNYVRIFVNNAHNQHMSQLYYKETDHDWA